MSTPAQGPLRGTESVEPERLRVLLVDDNASVLRFLVSAFGSSHCQVVTASTAEEAIERLGDDAFDLVVSDIKMPGLSGLDLLRVVKGEQPSTPVVLITGVPSVNSAVFGLRHGAYDYLPKPFSMTEVRGLLERVRRDRQSGAGSVNFPAGLAEELARRQAGIEALSRIGELGLQRLDTPVFCQQVLEKTLQSLRCDAAVLLMCDEGGRFSESRLGDGTLVAQLLRLLHTCFGEVVRTAGRETFQLTPGESRFEGLAAVVTGVGAATGILCIGRDSRHGAFLPDEHALLLGYAQTSSVALQKILLREQLEQNLIDTISSFVNALESKDPYLKGHSARVSLYSGELATVMGMPPSDVSTFSRAGMLHDLGKLVMLDHILRKPRQLTEEEFELIRSHPVVGDKILTPLRFLTCEARGVRNHHERYDGTGYPDGLIGERIPLVARVVAVADAFDAMTSDRAYRPRRPLEEALAEIALGAGSQFDPVAAEAFLSIPASRLQQVTQHFDSRQMPLGGTEVPSLAVLR